jgi:hypothetical protein
LFRSALEPSGGLCCSSSSANTSWMRLRGRPRSEAATQQLGELCLVPVQGRWAGRCVSSDTGSSIPGSNSILILGTVWTYSPPPSSMGDGRFFSFLSVGWIGRAGCNNEGSCCDTLVGPSYHIGFGSILTVPSERKVRRL